MVCIFWLWLDAIREMMSAFLDLFSNIMAVFVFWQGLVGVGGYIASKIHHDYVMDIIFK